MGISLCIPPCELFRQQGMETGPGYPEGGLQELRNRRAIAVPLQGSLIFGCQTCLLCALKAEAYLSCCPSRDAIRVITAT